MINSQKIWRVGLSSLLMKDLLSSSLTVFCQAVFAFTNAKTPQILDSHTCSTPNLIRETAQGKKNPWSASDSYSHDRSFALTEHQSFCSTERLCCEQHPDHSAIFHHCVFSQTTFPNEKTEASVKIHQQPTSLTSLFDFIHRHCRWASSIFLGSLWCCALGLVCPFLLPLGNTLCTDWSYHESRRNPRWSTGSIQVRYVFRSNSVKVMWPIKKAWTRTRCKRL